MEPYRGWGHPTHRGGGSTEFGGAISNMGTALHLRWGGGVSQDTGCQYCVLCVHSFESGDVEGAVIESMKVYSFPSLQPGLGGGEDHTDGVLSHKLQHC